MPLRTLRPGYLAATLLIGMTGCSGMSGLRPAPGDRARTLTAIGDRPIAAGTGEPGASSIADVSPPVRTVEASRELAGRVLDPEGRPVANAEVRLAIDGQGVGRAQRAYTDEAGRFTLADLREGTTYTLIADWSDGTGDFLSGRSRVRVPDRAVEITLETETGDSASASRRINRASSRGDVDQAVDDIPEPATLGSAGARARVNEEDLPMPESAEEVLADDGATAPAPLANRQGDMGRAWRRSGPDEEGTFEEESEPSAGDVHADAPRELASDPGDDRDAVLGAAAAGAAAGTAAASALEGGSAITTVNRPAASTTPVPDQEKLIEKALSGSGEPPVPVVGGSRVTAEPAAPVFPAIAPGQAGPGPASGAAAEPARPATDPTIPGVAPTTDPAPPAPSSDSGTITPPVLPPTEAEAAGVLPEHTPEQPPSVEPLPANDAPPPPVMDAGATAAPASMPATEPAATPAATEPPAPAAGPSLDDPPALAPVPGVATEPATDPPAPTTTPEAPAPVNTDLPAPATTEDPPAPAEAPLTPTPPTGGSGASGELEAAVTPARRWTWGDLMAGTAAAGAAASESTATATATAEVPPIDPRLLQASVEVDPQSGRIVGFQLPDASGQPLRLKDVDADYILLDFWGSWCPPCVRSIPHLVDLQQRLGGRLKVVGIAYEDGSFAERVAAVKAVSRRLGINYDIAIAEADGQPCPLREALQVKAYPTMILIDREGRILWRYQGASVGTLARLQKVIAANVAAPERVLR